MTSLVQRKLLFRWLLGCMFGAVLPLNTAVALEIRTGPDGKNRMFEGKQEVVFYLSHYSPGLVGSRSVGPVFMVQVQPDGTVLYQGRANVKTIGSVSHHLTENQFANFTEILRGFKKRRINSISHSLAKRGVASTWILLDGDVLRTDFGPENNAEYARFRHELEPYLHTYEYRCPIANPLRKLDWPQMKVATDICAQVYELESSISQGAQDGQDR